MKNHMWRHPPVQLLASVTGLTLALLLGAMACPKPQGVAALERPECPQDSVHITVRDTFRNTVVDRVVTTIPLAGKISNVPEFHDCQRFVMGPGAAYGPMVAIFASFTLGRLDTLNDSLMAAGGTGVVAAAAEIYNYDMLYRPLQIQPKFSCLYLWHDTPAGSAVRYKAKMVPIGSHENDCLHPVDPATAPGQLLEVRPIGDKTLSAADYPAVARWDWDSVRNEVYIGIKCGSQWCEVGRPNFTSSELPAVNPSNPLQEDVPGEPPTTRPEQDRIVRIKGWYDQQYLAIPNTSGQLDAGSVRGTAIPVPQLGRINDPARFKGRWVASAFITLDSPSSTYKGKLNLEEGINRVALCNGDAADCLPGQTNPPPCAAGPDGNWWARVISAGNHTSYHCVKRKDHPGVTIPGTVRWRWVNDDEKTWIRCLQGCCTVS